MIKGLKSAWRCGQPGACEWTDETQQRNGEIQTKAEEWIELEFSSSRHQNQALDAFGMIESELGYQGSTKGVPYQNEWRVDF